MIPESIRTIADAVLFEGYILYPYRPSAIKNRQRWNFGTLFPQEFTREQTPEEASSFYAEVLLEGSPATSLDFCGRFLQLAPRVDQSTPGWDQGLIRYWNLQGITVDQLLHGMRLKLDSSSLLVDDDLSAAPGLAQPELIGGFESRIDVIAEGLYRVSAQFSNCTPVAPDSVADRRACQNSAFHSAHLLAHADNGSFISLLDPPRTLSEAAAACARRGVYPVLVGPEGSRSDVLCAPIILYDYPHIAPESAGDFFDGTEIDEMLSLRVMTLTDEEKKEMRQSDRFARRILERTESLAEEHLLKSHGALRSIQPACEAEIDGSIQPWNPFEEKPPVDSVRLFGVELRKGGRVRVWPRKRADILDIAMRGKAATIEAIEQDLEGEVQVAVVLDDDPGRDLGLLRQPGHRFFFSPQELEPLDVEAK